jgi:long-chain acyl-CoA synthetase
MNSNLALGFTRAGQAYGQRPALRLGERGLSYAELDEATARVAGLLRELGVGPGDRVGVMLPNVPYFAFVYYGVLRAGGVVVPINVLLKQREVAFHLGDSQAKLLFAWHEFAEPAQRGADAAAADCVIVAPGEFERVLARTEPASEVVDRVGHDTAVILYTSGTTGTPKGAEITHSNLQSNVEVVVRMLSVGTGDVILGALPLFHAFGQTCGLNTAISSGACLALVPRFDAGRVLETIERERVTVFEAVPTMYVALLHHPGRERFDVSTLRLCVSGGAALPVEVLRGFEAAFECTVLEGYGLSETSPVASFSQADRERKPGSIGTPVNGVEMKVVGEDRNQVAPGEVGEIAIRGPNVMKGYWHRPDATADAIDQDGWFYTGDLARVDEDGYFFIVDRKKDMIIRGGYNIYPREIEEVFYEHPAVLEAAVIGVPHAELGEEVAAAVTLKPDAHVTADELRDYVKEQVAAYKYPRHVWLADELPKGTTGKVLKREIRIPAHVSRTAAPDAP